MTLPRFSAWLAACVLMLPAAAGAQSAPSAGAVKAAYLYKLRNYVEWPAGPAAPGAGTVIGIVGAENIAAHLERISVSKDPLRHPLAVRRLKLGDPVAGMHILFVGNDAWSRAAPMVAQAREQPVLVVSDSDGALEGGSMINFRLSDERIRFEISLDSAEKSKLKLSSQLLTLALSVVREKRK